MKRTSHALKAALLMTTVAAALCFIPVQAGQETSGPIVNKTKELDKEWEKLSKLETRRNQTQKEIQQIRDKADALHRKGHSTVDNIDAAAKLLRAQAKANKLERKLVNRLLQTAKESMHILQKLQETEAQLHVSAQREKRIRERKQKFLTRAVPILSSIMKRNKANARTPKIKNVRDDLMAMYQRLKKHKNNRTMPKKLKVCRMKLEELFFGMTSAKRLLRQEKQRILKANQRLKVQIAVQLR